MRSWLLAASASLLLATSPQPGACDPAAGGPITPADIMRLKDMREAEISPDGRTILFTVQQQMASFSPEHSTIWSAPPAR